MIIARAYCKRDAPRARSHISTKHTRLPSLNKDLAVLSDKRLMGQESFDRQPINFY